MNNFHFDQPFRLETGATLPSLDIAYHTYGTLNADKSNVVWICHALTANSNAAEWWKGIVGEGYIIDPDKYFIVCANILGSTYGTTGPLSINPLTSEPYYSAFPIITIRDMVNAHILLRRHLGIEKIYLLAGGSMGGYQALEWCMMESDRIDNLFLTATSAAESAWGIAVHASQRLAIEADITWNEPLPHAGQRGLKAARAIGLLSYRNYSILVEKQTDTDVDKLDDYKAASYINYQGNKLVNRFNAYSYWLLTKAMDSHHLARGRANNVEEVLATIPQRTLIIGISSDILCPVHEQEHIAQFIPNSTLVEIDSPYGHDGFIVEWEKITGYLKTWIEK
jgi:homoserine O-acetyltransferase